MNDIPCLIADLVLTARDRYRDRDRNRSLVLLYVTESSLTFNPICFKIFAVETHFYSIPIPIAIPISIIDV